MSESCSLVSRPKPSQLRQRNSWDEFRGRLQPRHRDTETQSISLGNRGKTSERSSAALLGNSVFLWRGYSYRKASTGSNRDARTAGKSPNTIPVTALTPSAATIAIGGVDAGTGVNRFTMYATSDPPTNPIAAPMHVSVAASTRNCHRIVDLVAP